MSNQRNFPADAVSRTNAAKPLREGGASALLRLLADDGAFARIEDERALVFASRKGITVRAGGGRASDLHQLVSDGALRCVPGRREPSYVIEAAGMARLKRGDCPREGRFLAQHAEIAAVAVDIGETVALNLRESPLLWLYRRGGKGGKMLGDAEFAAGERLRSDMTIARTMPRLTQNLERPSQSGVAVGLTPSEARLAAAQRVQTALATVGPELAGVLVDVCGFLKGLDLVERERGWPARSAKLVLCLALGALARHYGLGNMATGVQGRRRRHAWGAEGFRPAFSVTPPAPASPPS